MSKHFYSHIVETSSLSLALGDMDLSQEERLHLISLVEDNLHHIILDAILSELSDEDKKLFLSHITTSQHDKIWDLLHSKIENVEEKIKNIAETLKKELHEDIKNTTKP